ncbi:ABC transporter substrate-binding protein [Endozoicomonas sp. SM1973]|uniref:ABC transporter substrate-binding protein n=2 Tax=Spartinivicinus marinus TaxID=2994442 RepID=A0A853HZS4_9GAMM|nr:ABC transporter substrate-binding protein [Spartinivicinus marinus]
MSWLKLKKTILSGCVPMSINLNTFFTALALVVWLLGGISVQAVMADLPEEPLVTKMAPDQTIGKQGGTLYTLMAKSKDIRMMTVFGYARLVGFTRNFELKPDLLKDIIVEEGGRSFTLIIRKGHRWSDGHLFTAEDFRYYWEDIANNKKLSPFGPPQQLMVKGKPPTFTLIDEHTVRYRWDEPNPYFLPALAGARPLFIYVPAHYLKQFHASYTQAETLALLVDKYSKRNWAGLHHSRARQYKLTNPKLPVLQPWVNTTKPPSERFVFKRNPNYHRVDEKGQQLPYIDQVVINIASSSLIPAKARAGDATLQARYIRLDNYTFLKAGEKQGNYKVFLWKNARGSQVALYPNLNANDPEWRKLMQSAPFRRALSLAINRHEINQVVYYGLAIEGGNTVLPASPLYDKKFTKNWCQYDPKLANQLLDELGLTKRNNLGIRLLPDGRPMEIIVQSPGESTEQTDILELIRDHWRAIGIKLLTRPSQREVFRNRVFSGEAIMAVWEGLDNALPTAEMNPKQLAPSVQEQYQWSQWGKYYETGQGKPPQQPEVLELVNLHRNWMHAPNIQQKSDIWRQMLSIYADQVYTIGTVTGILQPLVVSNNLMNVPKEGWFSWEPGAYFGVYRMDTFWLKTKAGE